MSVSFFSLQVCKQAVLFNVKLIFSVCFVRVGYWILWNSLLLSFTFRCPLVSLQVQFVVICKVHGDWRTLPGIDAFLLCVVQFVLNIMSAVLEILNVPASVVHWEMFSYLLIKIILWKLFRLNTILCSK
jgi:hypothetical protein